MMQRPPASVALLSIAAFLAPIIGGQLPNEVEGIAPGWGEAVRSLFRGSEIAAAQHALLAALVCAAVAVLVVRRRILQVPHVWIAAPLVAFFTPLLGSVVMSAYHWRSLGGFAEWAVYGIALIACVTGLGRKAGPTLLLGSLCAGVSLIALLGILEYGQARAAGDPSWRIFAGWQNPNATAGMLGIGMLVAIGLLAAAQSSLGRFLAGTAVVLAGIALVLTGSKGGLLAVAAGLAVLEVLLLAWSGPKAILRGAVCLAIVALAVFAMQRTSNSSGGLRSFNAAATQEQSQGFRSQLWKGALSLIHENPVGRGLDTYPFYSTKPGTNTRTELAHSTWLQLGLEAGVLSPLALAAMLLAWMVLALRGAKNLPAGQNCLRASTVAAVVAVCAHGVVDSNLYYFGIGLSLFLLVGAGVQLSSDAGAPEFVAPPLRMSALVASVAVLAVLCLKGYAAVLQANVRWLAADGQVDAAREGVEHLKSVAPDEGETWYRAGMLAATSEQALAAFERANSVEPNTKYLRRLALVQQRTGDSSAAVASLQKALQIDPNNLPALKQLMDLQDALGRPQDAERTARRLIDVEDTPYFRIRAIPEIRPTETYEARIYLAQGAKDPRDLLRPAVEGLLAFAQTTLPRTRILESGGAAAGMSSREAEDKVRAGQEAAQRLERVYRDAGDSGGAAWASKAAKDFADALGGTK